MGLLTQGDDCIQKLIYRLVSNNSSHDEAVASTATKDESSSVAGEQQRNSVLHQRQRPYLLLLQHSQALALRRDQQQFASGPAATSTKPFHRSTAATTTSSSSNNHSSGRTDSDDIYRRAGLPTPSETATWDWHAGAATLEHIAAAAAAAPLPADNGNGTAAATVIWLGTLPNRPNSARHAWLEQIGDRVHIVDSCGSGQGGPFGWEESSGTKSEEHSSIPTLERLDSMDNAVQEILKRRGRGSGDSVVVMLESLAPLILRHGLTRTAQWLERVVSRHNSVALWVAPVLLETMSPAQHLVLEGMADAVLRLQHGTGQLIRRSIRHAMHPLVRESFSYSIRVDTKPGAGARIQRRELRVHSGPKSASKTDVTATEVPVLAPETTPVSSLRPKSTPLSIHEGSREATTAPTVLPPTQTSAPRIYMQDDDPEFDDFDEEDPDDDLDL
jgi:hypothetical protein